MFLKILKIDFRTSNNNLKINYCKIFNNININYKNKLIVQRINQKNIKKIKKKLLNYFKLNYNK